MIKEENKKVLELFKDLRVADVRDGMDWIGMHHYGSMTTDVRPLFRKRVVGIANTVRYLPYQGPDPIEKGDDYTKWQGWYYGNVCCYPWIDEIEEGDFIVIDQSQVDAGLMGSENTLRGIAKGAVGYITNGGVRDTDEIMLQKVPFWSKFISQSMVQTRLQFDHMNIPVAVNGVTVYPGDVIVADGDGVIVVPRRMALDVAKYAHQELCNDKKSRRALYEKVGLPIDDTVKQ